MQNFSRLSIKLQRASLAVALSLAAAGSLHANLVVSGDSNLGNGINGTSGASVVAGNTTFFTNLLGSGSTVVFQTTTNSDSSETNSQGGIIGLYTGLGKTVNSVTTVTGANLAGANLLISFLPDTAYTSAEMTAIQNFLNGGGTVLLTGEYSPFDPTADGNINALLTFLGSSMSINLNEFDSGFHTASGSQINATPYTAGVTSFVYAATASVNGGTAIFNTTTGQPFMAYTSSSTTTVPEPGTISLLFLALAGSSVVVRKKVKS